jgi:hypothetical protein
MNNWQSLIFVLLLGGCATSPEQAADAGDEMPEPGERVCVNVRSINSFDAIDDKHVYIRANVNDHYLFTMWGGCYGLRNAQSIAVKDTFSRVCSNSFGEIIYRDLGRRLESCKIQTIEPVAGREDAEGLVKDRREAAQEKRAEEESKQ